MTQKTAQLYKDIKEAIANFRSFVLDGSPLNTVVGVSDIICENVTYFDTDITCLEKCTGGTFLGTLRLHFESENSKTHSIPYRINYAQYKIDKYENERFFVSIECVVVEEI